MGLSDENDGHERLACAGIRNPLTISVSTIKDIFNLKRKKEESAILLVNIESEENRFYGHFAKESIL